MPLTKEQLEQLQFFFNNTNFAEDGAVITDLDGTAIHEFQGKYTVPKLVEHGLKKINDLGRPVVINTLRFPLSVMRTFGREWYSISNAPVPTVLMNGSQLGYMFETKEGELSYEEITAFPLDYNEIMAVIEIVEKFLADGINELLVFYYPRQWTKGEIIWTPVPEKIPHVRTKYLSASHVYSSETKQLTDDLTAEDICMVFLLIELQQDKLMAYQHTKKNNFFTRQGVDKLYGAEQIAAKLNFVLEHSVGAGDTEMDSFLQGVGLAIHVGRNVLSYHGTFPTMKVSNSDELGELFFTLAAMQKTSIT